MQRVYSYCIQMPHFSEKKRKENATHFISSNSPSGGTKLTVFSALNLVRLTHWWNVTSSSSIVFPLPHQKMLIFQNLLHMQNPKDCNVICSFRSTPNLNNERQDVLCQLKNCNITGTNHCHSHIPCSAQTFLMVEPLPEPPFQDRFCH
jgi:hypothetical protein